MSEGSDRSTSLSGLKREKKGKGRKTFIDRGETKLLKTKGQKTQNSLFGKKFLAISLRGIQHAEGLKKGPKEKGAPSLFPGKEGEKKKK